MFSRSSTLPAPPSNSNTPDKKIMRSESSMSPNTRSPLSARTPKLRKKEEASKSPQVKTGARGKATTTSATTATKTSTSAAAVGGGATIKRSNSNHGRAGRKMETRLNSPRKLGTPEKKLSTPRHSPDPQLDPNPTFRHTHTNSNSTTKKSSSAANGRDPTNTSVNNGWKSSYSPSPSAPLEGLGVDSPNTAISPVVHIRIRPLLPYLGEHNDARHVWFLDQQNLVVRHKPGNPLAVHSRSGSELSSPTPPHSITSTPPALFLGQRIGPGTSSSSNNNNNNNPSNTSIMSSSSHGNGGSNAITHSPRKNNRQPTTGSSSLNSSLPVGGPLSSTGNAANAMVQVDRNDDNEEQHFSFEFVHDEDASQEEVFEESVLRFADEALLAQNIAILCYGPTGSGKTFSMMGDQHPTSASDVISSAVMKRAEGNRGEFDSPDGSLLDLGATTPKGFHARTVSQQIQYDNKQLIASSMGILPRLVTVLLEHKEQKVPLKKDCHLTLKDLTFYGVEIYMDELSDLLDKNKRRITNVTDTGGLESLCERLEQAKEEQRLSGAKGKKTYGGGIQISSTDDLHRAYRLARRNRVTSSHTQNDTSSRSHAIFILQLGFAFTKVGADGAETVTRVQSYVAMVDLAGCERVKETKVEGQALREAQYINKSLSALSSVVLSLFKRSSHVPYRDSKLTRLLRPCLEGGRVLTLVHVSPCSSSNTINALKFADQIKHTKVRTHNFGASTSKKQLLDIYEELTDPSQQMLEESVEKSVQQYAQLCAEIRLFYLSRFANHNESFAAAVPLNSGNTIDSSSLNSVNVSSLGEISRNNLENSGLDTGVNLSPPNPSLPLETTPTTARGTVLKSIMSQYLAPLWEQNEEESQAAIRWLERERDRTVESAEQKRLETIATLKAAIETLDRENAFLSEQNTAPMLCDPFEVELNRLMKETLEEVQELSRENQSAQNLVNLLRQRISIQAEVEDAIQGEIDVLMKRAETEKGSPEGGELVNFNASLNAFEMTEGTNDNEMQEIFKEQIYLSDQLARLRIEVECAQHAGIIFEGLWAHVMRTELYMSLRSEIALMEDILLDSESLELLLDDMPPNVSVERPQSTVESNRSRSDSHVTASSAGAYEAKWLKVKDYLDEARLADVVVSRQDSPLSSEDEDKTLQENKRKDEKEIMRRISSYHRRGANSVKTLPNPLQSLQWASMDDFRLTNKGTISSALTGSAANPGSPNTATTTTAATNQYTSASKELNSILEASIPLSLVGSYNNEEDLQHVAVRKLLEEGVLCEVCCTSSSFQPLLDHYLVPSASTSTAAGQEKKKEGVKGESGDATATDEEREGRSGAEIQPLPQSNITGTSRWGLLRLRNTSKANRTYVLEFIYSPGSIPISRKLLTAMAGEQERRDELIDFVDSLPSSLNLRRGVTPSANSPAALNPVVGASTSREHRLFSIPLSETELQLNLHVLEAGVTRFTPTTTTTHSNAQNASSTSAGVSVGRRPESGGQVVLEILGVPSQRGEPMVNAFVKQSKKSATAKGKENDADSKEPVLAKKLRGGGELILPSACTLGNQEGTCSFVFRFPSPTFTQLTQTESIEMIVGALSGILPPTFSSASLAPTAPSSPSNPRKRPSVHGFSLPPQLQLQSGGAITHLIYPHVPYVTLFPEDHVLKPTPSLRSFSREPSTRPRRGESVPQEVHQDPNKMAPAQVERQDSIQSLRRGSVDRAAARESCPVVGAALEVKFYMRSLHQNDVKKIVNDIKKELGGEETEDLMEKSLQLYSRNNSPRKSHIDESVLHAATGDNTMLTSDQGISPSKMSYKEKLLAQQRQRKAKYCGKGSRTTLLKAPSARPSISNAEVSAVASASSAAKRVSHDTSPADLEAATIAAAAKELVDVARLLHQLRAVTVDFTRSRKGDRRSRLIAHVGGRLDHLQGYRKNVLSLIKQQIYEAEDISENLGVSEVVGGRGAYLQEIEQEARYALNLVLPASNVLALTPMPTIAGESEGRVSVNQTNSMSLNNDNSISVNNNNNNNHPNDDGNSPFVRSDVEVHEARELCGNTVPWTIWQWGYRWPMVSSLYHQESSLWSCLTPSSNAGQMPGVGATDAGQNTDGRSSVSAPWSSPASIPPLIEELPSDDEDELFGFDNRMPWKMEADEQQQKKVHKVPRTVWLPELNFATLPPYLSSMGQSGDHSYYVE